MPKEEFAAMNAIATAEGTIRLKMVTATTLFKILIMAWKNFKGTYQNSQRV